MHVALVSEFDLRDVGAWSGIPRFVADALERSVDRVSYVGPLPAPATLSQRVSQVRSRIQGHRFLRAHTLDSARRQGEAASAALRSLAPDAVLSIGSTPVGFIDTPAPIAMWSDATFESNLYFYEDYAGMEAANVDEGHAVEAAAQERAAFACYASENAARSAWGYYGTDRDRVVVVPFGANLPDPPDAAAVERAIEERSLDRCQLLFLGKGWVRKGGDVAVRVARELDGGMEAELVVAGSDVPPGDTGDAVRSVGFLDKRTPGGRATLDRLFRESHFYIMPSRAEAFGCVFCEASAYGVPSLAPSVGGIPTAVEDGVNGVLFPARPTPTAIADRVRQLLGDPDAYRALCRSSRARFERELNWDAAVGRIMGLLGASADAPPAAWAGAPHAREQPGRS